MRIVEAKEIMTAKTGKYDANHAKDDGQYKFFTCAIEPLNTDTFSFDDEVLILPGNGANVGEVLYHKGKLEAYQRTYVLHKITEHPRYIFYYFKKYWIRQITKRQVGSATNYIKMDDILSFQIPLPPLPIQKKIAAILDAADAYRQKTKALIEKYDELAQSLFLDMFGDPVRNEKGWELISLHDYGEFKNGLNFSSTETGNRVKYIGVGDFKSLYKIEDIESLSTVNLTSLPSQSYFLKNGDLLLVRSNGNRNLVGRCLTVFPNNTLVTYSGFCIRYRIQSPNMSSMFLTFLFRNKKFKQYMLSGGRGANIQNINQKMLMSLKIIKPGIEQQNKFEIRIKEIEDQKEKAINSMQKSEELFQSLLQRAFKGELIN